MHEICQLLFVWHACFHKSCGALASNSRFMLVILRRMEWLLQHELRLKCTACLKAVALLSSVLCSETLAGSLEQR